MKRNNSGFTLVELLAAIVILGILVTFAGPIVVNMVQNNKNKIYVSDAQKLIAQAEYKIRSSGSTIEIPDPGDAIVISLVYLDSSDFDSPPNNGKYIEEASYVVVKNNDGKMEYSVSIVEKMKKGGYKGVELTRDIELDENGLRHVKVFEQSNVVKVLDSQFTESYVNKYLGTDYIGSDKSISAVYNYPDLADSSAAGDTAKIPTIRKATLTSATELQGSLNTVFTLKVDDDKPRNELKIYLSVNGSYEEALNSEPLSYGNNNTFVKKYNFLEAPYNMTYGAGETINLYVVVKDSDNYEVRKFIEYEVHKNEAPSINTAQIVKRDLDPYNMTVASLSLALYDDFDNDSTLEVCLSEDRNSTEEDCGNYSKYTDLFKDGKMDYQFKCNSSGCVRDGTTHYLKIFVRDSGSSYATAKTLSYVFSKNTSPVVDVSVESVRKGFLDSGDDNDLNAKEATVKVNISDDLDQNKFKVVLKDDKGAKAEYDSYQDGDEVLFTFSGDYTGDKSSRTRTLYVDVYDSEGGHTQRTVDNYELYLNKAPKINNFSIDSVEKNICIDEEYCGKENINSPEVNVTLNVSDDMDEFGNSESDDGSKPLLVCLSDDASKCDCNSYSACAANSNYKEASNYYSQVKSFEFNTGSLPYDGSKKTLYAYVIDSYNQKVGGASLGENLGYVDYTLYKNESPVITSFDHGAIDNSILESVSNMKFFMEIHDDMDYLEDFDGVVTNNLEIAYCYKDTTGEKCSDYIEYANEVEVDPTFINSTDKKVDIYAKVRDSYGSITTSKTFTFDTRIATDKAPNIEGTMGSIGEKHYFDANSKEVSADKAAYVIQDVDVAFIVTDSNDTYSVCVSHADGDASSSINGDDNMCDDYSTEFDGDNNTIKHVLYQHRYEASKEEELDNQSLILYVKDSFGKTSSSFISLREKDTCPDSEYNPINFEYSFKTGASYTDLEGNTVTSNQKISAARCGGKCYYTDVSGNVNSITGYYHKTITYADKFSAETQCENKVSDKDFVAYCNYKDCFYNTKTNNYVMLAIGIYEYKIDENENEITYTTDDGTVYTSDTYFKLYNSAYTPGAETVTLTETPTRIIPKMIKDGYFKFDSNSQTQYVRIDDTYY